MRLEGVASLKGNPSERLSPFVTAGPTSAKELPDGSDVDVERYANGSAVDTEHRIYAPTPSRN